MLSVVIISKNEAANIARCLESVKWADEVIVLDSGSSDKTVEIALRYTQKVYENTEWLGYGIQKQRALSLATQEWVLNLDADEVVSDDLRETIQEVMQSNEASGYRIPIRMMFYGQLLHYSNSPKRHIRLFRREGARFSDDIVHEKIILPEKSHVKQLASPIIHHSFQDLSHALAKLNRYSSYSARVRLRHKEKTSFPGVLAGTAWMFFRCFFLQLGMLDGKAGFLLAILSAQGTFYRGMKQLYPDKRKGE